MSTHIRWTSPSTFSFIHPFIHSYPLNPKPRKSIPLPRFSGWWTLRSESQASCRGVNFAIFDLWHRRFDDTATRRRRISETWARPRKRASSRKLNGCSLRRPWRRMWNFQFHFSPTNPLTQWHCVWAGKSSHHQQILSAMNCISVWDYHLPPGAKLAIVRPWVTWIIVWSCGLCICGQVQGRGAESK